MAGLGHCDGHTGMSSTGNKKEPAGGKRGPRIIRAQWRALSGHAVIVALNPWRTIQIELCLKVWHTGRSAAADPGAIGGK